MIQYRNKKYVCHLDLAMDLIRGKWKAVILCKLNDGCKGFLELQRQVPGISHKVLYEKLGELESDGLINRKTLDNKPPKVEISLTHKGLDLFPHLNAIQEWAIKNL